MTPRRVDAVAACGYVVVLATLLYRVTVGVGLSDESYYATFLDAWLKDGLAGSPMLVLHQTAMLLAYPVTLGFVRLTGGEDGLMLFLRSLFVLLTIATSCAVFVFAKRAQGRRTAMLVATYSLAFIPFSLPAVSYNTVGMLGIVSGLMLAGLTLLPGARRPLWLSVAAAIVLTGAAVAYPPLAPIPFLLGAAFLLSAEAPGQRTSALALLALSAGGGVMAASLVVVALGLGKTLAMLRFTTEVLGGNVGPLTKLALAVQVFQQHPFFLAQCVLALALGAWLARAQGRKPGQAAVCLAGMALMVLSSLASSPALFLISHETVVLVTLCGACPIGFSTPQTAELRRPVRLLFAMALLAGACTLCFATNGLMNFPIGGFGAALLSLMSLAPRAGSAFRPARVAYLAFAASAIVVTVKANYTLIYGEIRNPLFGDAQRVPSGPFAGLLTTREQSTYIDDVARLLDQAGTGSSRFMAIGRLPGFYLLTRMRPVALSTWNFSQAAGAIPRLERATDEFYEVSGHQPDFVGVPTDPWTRPPTPAEERVLSHYTPVRRVSEGASSFVLYARHERFGAVR